MTFQHFYSTAAVVFNVMIWSKDNNEKGASDPFYDGCLVYWASNIEAEVVDCRAAAGHAFSFETKSS